MKSAIFLLLAVTMLVAPTYGHGGPGDFGGFGRFGGSFGFGRGDGLGEVGAIGFDFFNVDRVQERYEDRLESLQTKYEDGVADDTEFFTTDLYERIVSRTETLSDSYGLFLSGLERSIDRIADVIAIANADLTYYSDLLSDYQADDSLSDARLARIEQYITRITDRLDSRIDFLTGRQAALQSNLSTYQSFETEISSFLSTITAAGGTTTDVATDNSAASLKSLAILASASETDTSVCAIGSNTVSPNVVPEPAAAVLGLTVASLLLSRRRQR